MKKVLTTNMSKLQRDFRKVIFFLLFLMINSKLDLCSADFDLMPINVHFFGAVVAGKNIIAYGSNGCYMMTTDRGANWKQYSLHPNGNITYMVNYRDTIWGVIDDGIVIYSTDYGWNWEKISLDINKNEKLYYILPTDGHLFLRSTRSVYKVDRNFNVLGQITDNLLEIKMQYIN
ncbi:MAG: WD40/YVTN/BNR-like repeat-containing protein, partial [Candidatus Kapaibacteriota bacterium]